MTDERASQGRVHAVVHGRVQGVNFRYYTTRTARRLQLTGWVTNRRDGTVETVAEGKRGDLEEFVDFLHRGSPSARVDNVDVEWNSPKGDFSGFSVRYR